MKIDSLTFFEELAAEMNAHPERYAVLGEADMTAAIVMHRDDSDAFRAVLRFVGLQCESVAETDATDARAADYRLEGSIDAWRTMFADIEANGVATGRQTINSLALLATDIVLRADDPMGEDKFSRFNQTLQEYLDGASKLPTSA